MKRSTDLQSMKKKESVPIEKLSIPSLMLRYLRQWALLWYYRYSVEIGISVLDGWEAFIVNSVFLLLLVSIIKQVLKGLNMFTSHIYTSLK
ncbi:hypothetical protein NEMIN01_1198 [Nematocida minor]|uniref:uncharacterized protein n=1 Tax=Nematocida minor TaxID=1912983 RepID=UPI00221FE284|nr:uncharacterized protein NEMIN01_1198 [Nematocida minor]KAI5190796.1 hypothetical protein NEMIN01_1198 [Nematocida minor]